MKNLIYTSILAILMASVTTVRAQDYPEEYLGLPGDNLNLYAVMKLFQESETLEAFERNLNDENSRINNLDLNGDNMVDYLTVSDYVDGNVHNIVLRAALDRNEYQDVAVFTVEKLRNGSVQIQLIGDEALYGRNYIVEPIYAETPNPGYRGRTVYRDNVTVVTTTYYEVAAWPVIRFIYNPYYVSWRSSWYWGYYPVYWRPWRPYYWHFYYGYHSHWYPHYYAHYRYWDRPRYHRYHDYYYKSVRAYSPNVSHRITEGHYRKTYSRPEMRRDGEALYASTHGSRSSTARPAASSDSQRRSSSATSSRSSASQAAGQNGESRRSSTAVQSRSTTRTGASQGGDASRRSSTAVQNRSTSGSAASQSGDMNRRSQGSSSGTVSRSSSSSRSSGTVSRSSGSSSRSSGTVSRSSGSSSRSSGTVSRSSGSSSKSSKSSKSSDNNSRSSKR